MAVDSVGVSVPSCDVPVIGGALGWLLSHAKNSAPVKGITLSTRVGRLSRTHFELGFSVNAIPRWEGKRWNRKVAKSAEKYC